MNPSQIADAFATLHTYAAAASIARRASHQTTRTDALQTACFHATHIMACRDTGHVGLNAHEDGSYGCDCRERHADMWVYLRLLHDGDATRGLDSLAA